MPLYRSLLVWIKQNQSKLKAIGIVLLFLLGGSGIFLGNRIALSKNRLAWEKRQTPQISSEPAASAENRINPDDNQDNNGFSDILPKISSSDRPQISPLAKPSPSPLASHSPFPSPPVSPSPSPSPYPSPKPICTACQKDNPVETCGNPALRACENVDGGSYCVAAGDVCIKSGSCGCASQPSPSATVSASPNSN